VEEITLDAHHQLQCNQFVWKKWGEFVSP